MFTSAHSVEFLLSWLCNIQVNSKNDLWSLYYIFLSKGLFATSSKLIALKLEEEFHMLERGTNISKFLNCSILANFRLSLRIDFIYL